MKRSSLHLRFVSRLPAAALAVLAACGQEPPGTPDAVAPAAGEAATASKKPSTRLPALPDTPRKAGPPPEVDDLFPVDISDPEVRPHPGEWEMTSHVMTSNTCAYDPRETTEGPCTMGCAPTRIEAAGPGLFTLDAPSIRYLGTCAVVDGGHGFTCRGGVAMVPGEMVLKGDFTGDYEVDGRWTLTLVEGSLDPGCIFTGEFHARELPKG